MSSPRNKFKMSTPGIIPLDLWNSLIDLIYSQQIISVNGGRFSQDDTGTQLDIDSGGNGANHAFKIRQTAGGTEVKVAVDYGIVGSGSIKAQVDGTDIDASTVPELTMAAGTNIIYLEVTTTTATGSTIASAGVQIDVAATLPSATSTKGYIELGRVIVSGSSPNLTAKIYQSIYNSLGYEKGVGTGHYFWAL